MANAQVLQNAVNRFSTVASFMPIAVDGAVGPATLAATAKALDYISIEIEGGPIPAAVSQQAAAFAVNAARSSSVLAANAPQVGAFLNYVADLAHLNPVLGPAIVPQANAAVAAATNILAPFNTGTSASVFNTLKNLPTWQKVMLGAIGVFGFVAVSHKLKERKQLSGLYY